VLRYPALIMWNTFQHAVTEGLIVGAKWATALLVVVVVLSWWAGDYWTVRQRAEHGEQAFQFIVRQQQQATASKPPADR